MRILYFLNGTSESYNKDNNEIVENEKKSVELLTYSHFLFCVIIAFISLVIGRSLIKMITAEKKAIEATYSRGNLDLHKVKNDIKYVNISLTISCCNL